MSKFLQHVTAKGQDHLTVVFICDSPISVSVRAVGKLNGLGCGNVPPPEMACEVLPGGGTVRTDPEGGCLAKAREKRVSWVFH